MAEIPTDDIGTDTESSDGDSGGGDDGEELSDREMQRRIRQMQQENDSTAPGTEPTQNSGSDPMMDGATTEIDGVDPNNGMPQFMDSPGEGVSPDSSTQGTGTQDESPVDERQGTGVGSNPDTGGDEDAPSDAPGGDGADSGADAGERPTGRTGPENDLGAPSAPQDSTQDPSAPEGDAGTRPTGRTGPEDDLPGDTGGQTGGGESTPREDINEGRRGVDRGPDGSVNPDEREPAPGETGLGDTPESPEDAQRQAVGSQIEKEFIRENPDITSRDQVDVVNVRRTEDGDFTGEIVLTEEGREAVAEADRERLTSLGTTGRVLSASAAEAEREQAEARLARTIGTSQFARQQFTEQIARENDLLASDVAVDTTGGDIDVGLTIGGRRRAVVEQAAAGSEFTEDELVATAGEDGEFSAQLTDDELREQAAADNPDVDPGDLEVVERRDFRADAGLFAAAGQSVPDTTSRDVQLTDEAEAELMLEAAKEESPNANFEIVDKNGEPTVVREERFDDDGRFLGIPGGEDALESAEKPVGEFLGGAGQAIGTAAGLQTDLILSTTGVTDLGEVSAATGRAGAQGAQVFNVPGLALTLDEAGEVIGAGGAAAVSSIDTDADISEGKFPTVGVDPEPLEEFGREAGAGAQMIGSSFQRQFKDDPVGFGGGLAASLLFAGGAFRAASAGTRTGQAVRGVVQPGEEAFAVATGVRPATLAARGTSSLRSRVPDLRSRSFRADDRGQLELERSSREAEQTQVELTGRETAADFDRPVAELNISEGTRRQILENTAKASEGRRAEQDVDIASEGDLEMEALRRMPDAEAFPNQKAFQQSLERHKQRIRSEASAELSNDMTAAFDTRTAAAAGFGGMAGATAFTSSMFRDQDSDAAFDTESAFDDGDSGVAVEETAAVDEVTGVDTEATLGTTEPEVGSEVGVETFEDTFAGFETVAPSMTATFTDSMFETAQETASPFEFEFRSIEREDTMEAQATETMFDSRMNTRSEVDGRPRSDPKPKPDPDFDFAGVDDEPIDLGFGRAEEQFSVNIGTSEDIIGF